MSNTKFSFLPQYTGGTTYAAENFVPVSETWMVDPSSQTHHAYVEVSPGCQVADRIFKNTELKRSSSSPRLILEFPQSGLTRNLNQKWFVPHRFVENVNVRSFRGATQDNAYVHLIRINPHSHISRNWKGENLAITGTLSLNRDAFVAQYFRPHGISLDSSVKKSTKALIVGAGGDQNSKIWKARKFGVEIISEKEFLSSL